LRKQKKAAESVINAKGVNANILVQEFIKEANGKDIRCFVIDGKLLLPFKRSDAREFRANIHLGGTATVIKATMKKSVLRLKQQKPWI
jgi:ribosomal protein S6--L-glutamate ligase